MSVSVGRAHRHAFDCLCFAQSFSWSAPMSAPPIDGRRGAFLPDGIVHVRPVVHLCSPLVHLKCSVPFSARGAFTVTIDS
jgi:hypothetical protein